MQLPHLQEKNLFIHNRKSMKNNRVKFIEIKVLDREVN